MVRQNIRPEDDFYETPSKATYAMLAHINIPQDVSLWEPACGAGAISKILESLPGQNPVYSSDLNSNGYGTPGLNFLHCDWKPEGKFWIITNPPYKYAADFVRKGLELGAERIIMFLRFNFLESATRREDILENQHLMRVLLIKERVTMYPARYTGEKGSATTPHAWFMWDKNYMSPVKNEIIVRRINLRDGEDYEKSLNLFRNRTTGLS